VLTYKHNLTFKTLPTPQYCSHWGGGGGRGGGGVLSTRNWGGGGVYAIGGGRGVSQQNSKTRDQVSSPKRSALSLGASHLIPTSNGAQHLCGRPMAPTFLPCRSAVLTGLPQRASGRSGYTEVSNRLYSNSSLQKPTYTASAVPGSTPCHGLDFLSHLFILAFSLFSLLITLNYLLKLANLIYLYRTN
jgi:hypothetical protein